MYQHMYRHTFLGSWGGTSCEPKLSAYHGCRTQAEPRMALVSRAQKRPKSGFLPYFFLLPGKHEIVCTCLLCSLWKSALTVLVFSTTAQGRLPRVNLLCVARSLLPSARSREVSWDEPHRWKWRDFSSVFDNTLFVASFILTFEVLEPMQLPSASPARSSDFIRSRHGQLWKVRGGALRIMPAVDGIFLSFLGFILALQRRCSLQLPRFPLRSVFNPSHLNCRWMGNRNRKCALKN